MPMQQQTNSSTNPSGDIFKMSRTDITDKNESMQQRRRGTAGRVCLSRKGKGGTPPGCHRAPLGPTLAHKTGRSMRGVSTVIACGNNPVKQSDMLTQAASDHPKRCQWWGCNKCTTKHTKGDSRPKCVKSKRKQTNKRGTKPVNNSTPTRQGGREEAVARVLTVGRRDGAQRVTTLL